jgi:hypothetical protein
LYVALPFSFLFYKFICIGPNQVSGGIGPNQVSGGIVGGLDCQNAALVC